MSDNKFIKHLRGEDTAKSVLEIKNQRTTTSFANMPEGTSNANDVYSDHRGNAAAVLKGTENWKLSGSDLIQTTTVYGDGRDLTDSFEAAGNGLWVDASHTFATPAVFTAKTKWVLKLCGHSLDTAVNNTISFTLLIKFGQAITIAKNFEIRVESFEFAEEMVIDFDEGYGNVIKAAAGSQMTVQLLCADPDASATIYNGMTVFTALQRRVDGDAVASDKKTFDEVVDDVEQLQEDVDDLEQYVDDTFVRLDGNSIMTGPLKMRATSSFQCAIAPFWDGVGFFKLNSDNSVTLIASIDTPDGFLPWTTNTYNIGSSLKKWKNLYLSGKAYVATINNGADLSVPNKSGTLATMDDVELAARSGRMLTDQGVWYAKMYAATVPPAAENGKNYADFSQVDSDNNPIIVIYEGRAGMWVQSETITPPADYDGYVPVTSKIWDITEQSGQQGGRVLWNHTSKEFTPYPTIISFENASLTGNSTVVMPNNPTDDNITNKKYVDDAISAIPAGGSGLNVGDIFLTMRNDNELNGAVECDGATYNTTDFTGAQSIGNLLADGKVPYVSMAVYASTVAAQGWCDKFGWDGTGNIQFKVPTLSAYIWQKNTAGIKGSIGQSAAGQYGKYFVAQDSSFTQYTEPGAGGYGVNVTNNQTIPGASVDMTNTLSDQRVMVQLAVSATDEAVETCTSVLADVAALKYDYVTEFQAPTAENNYTWYRKYASGWVEQGGYATTSGNTGAQITLPVTMSDAHYLINGTCDNNTTGGVFHFVIYENQTTNGFVASPAYAGEWRTGAFYWEVRGMAAS